MVKRTKEEAEHTRNLLLDGARRVFLRKGVSRTTLADIATEVGVTRGAVYHHFVDKAALFQAMMDRAHLPFDAITRPNPRLQAEDPLDLMFECLMQGADCILSNVEIQETFEIMMTKCEWTEDMAALKARDNQCRDEHRDEWARAFEVALERGLLRPGIVADQAARALIALIEGLLFNYLDQGLNADFKHDIRFAVSTYLQGLRKP